MMRQGIRNQYTCNVNGYSVGDLGNLLMKRGFKQASVGIGLEEKTSSLLPVWTKKVGLDNSRSNIATLYVNALIQDEIIAFAEINKPYAYFTADEPATDPRALASNYHSRAEESLRAELSGVVTLDTYLSNPQSF